MGPLYVQVKTWLTVSACVALVLVHLVSPQLAVDADDYAGAGMATCCCSVDADSSAGGSACACDGSDMCGMAECANANRTVQPLLGAAWLFAPPLTAWIAVPTDGNHVESRTILPSVPPPMLT